MKGDSFFRRRRFTMTYSIQKKKISKISSFKTKLRNFWRVRVKIATQIQVTVLQKKTQRLHHKMISLLPRKTIFFVAVEIVLLSLIIVYFTRVQLHSRVYRNWLPRKKNTLKSAMINEINETFHSHSKKFPIFCMANDWPKREIFGYQKVLW